MITLLQWNLSIMVTLGPDIFGLYIQVAVIEKTCIRWSAAFILVAMAVIDE